MQTRMLSISALMALLMAGFAVANSDFWENKDYSKWSQQECKVLLHNSPWAKKYDWFYTVQVRSALPVRQALIRQMQIAQKYDKFSLEDQRMFDSRASRLLSIVPSDPIVLHVSYCGRDSDETLYGRNTPERENDQCRALARYWQVQTTETLKNSVWMIPGNKEKIPLLQYSSSQNTYEFDFVFPRQIDGRPVIMAEDKSFKLEFSLPNVELVSVGDTVAGDYETRGRTRALVEFRLDRMFVRGNIVY